MKKMLLTLLESLALLTFALLAASCGGGGGGGGGDDETAATNPVQNENSSVNIVSPTYNYENLGITSNPSVLRFEDGSSVSFATSYVPVSGGDEESESSVSYAWYIDGMQKGNGNTLSYTASGIGGHCLLLIIRDGAGYHGDTKSFTVVESTSQVK